MKNALDAFRLDHKVAIVTGAGARENSIGQAYALALADAGAKVVVADLQVEGAQKVAKLISDRGGDAIGVGVDIAKAQAVDEMVTAACDTYGGVDILVNNAALMVEIERSALWKLPLEEWNRVMTVNLTGALMCAQSCIPIMLERGGGKIVNQTSGAAFPPWGAYGVSKLALVGLTTALAREVARKNINVNAIAPGMTTSSAGVALTDVGTPLRDLIDQTAFGKPAGAPEDLIGTLLLLCSSAGDWINGQVIFVDGGWIVRP